MSLPIETVTSYIAVVTTLPDTHSLFVPGMETYFSTFPIVVYKSPNQLLEQLNQSVTPRVPRLIVMDITRSTDTNLNVLRELKANERFRSIPVLMQRVSKVSSRKVVATATSQQNIDKKAVKYEKTRTSRIPAGRMDRIFDREKMILS